MNLFEDESILLSRLLDKMGYGQTMNFLRKETFKKRARYLSGDQNKFYVLICGSKGEGMSKYLESDTDSMTVSTEIICTECARNYVNCETKTVFYLDTEQSSPGYTMLRLIFNRLLDRTFPINENLVQMPGGLFLSSEAWKQSRRTGMAGLTELGIWFAQRIGYCSGPSIQSFGPWTFTSFPEDNVFGLECECPSLLRAWINRSRPSSWPSPELVRAVSETRAHVVPVGNTGSPFQLLEWRICFTEAELILIQHLKPCYTKALILLKAVTKRTLKPICKEITSYVVKNVVLWIAESDRSETSSETRLIAIFQKALKFLKSCIWKNNFPSYMIERRNIFAGRLTRRSRLCARIDFLLKEGPRAVLRCGTVKHYLEMLFHSPEVLQRNLLRVRACEIYMMESDILAREKFSLENMLNYDRTTCYRIFIEDEDFKLLADRYEALWQILLEEQTETSSDDDILSYETLAEITFTSFRKRIPLIFGL